MSTSYLLLVAISMPFIWGLVILCIGRFIGSKARDVITVFCSAITFATIYIIDLDVTKGIEPGFWGFKVIKGVSFALKGDYLGTIFALIASFLWICASLYSIGYMRAHKEKHLGGFYAAFAFAIGSAIGIAFAGNLLTFFIFFEMLTVSTYPLVIHGRDKKSIKAGHQYLAYTLISGQLFLAGIFFLYAAQGTLTFVPGGFYKGDVSLVLGILIFFITAAGGMVKAGLMPFHSWLPNAMVAPTPVSALLHAVAVVKAGCFCMIRLIYYVFGPDFIREYHVDKVLIAMAGSTIVLGSLIALTKDNLKARLAYSTVSQLSYIVLGAAILSDRALMGAQLHLVAHAFMKITLFMCAGAIFVKTGKTEISQLRGMGYKEPLIMICFTISAIAMAGTPLLVGFVSKSNLILGAYVGGKGFAVVILIISSLLSLSYFVPISIKAFTKGKALESGGKAGVMKPAEVMGNGNKIAAQNPRAMHEYHSITKMEDLLLKLPIFITTLVVIILGLYPNAFFDFFSLAQEGARAIFG